MLKKVEENQKVVCESGDLFAPVAWSFFLIPKNLLSWIVGALSRIQLPPPVSVWANKLFVMIFGIDMTEAEKEVHQYESIEEVFTRKIKLETRPVVGPVCSPADGMIAMSGPAESGFAVQAKGITYSLAELILGERADPNPLDLDLQWFTTVYLAPHNYHRCHVPVTGTLKHIRYIPGELWPVNMPFVRRIPRLFNRNERLVFDFELENGGKVYAVMVGALNVGRIETPFWTDMIANSWSRQFGARPLAKSCNEKVEIGQEMGTFLLGSTVVMAFDAKAMEVGQIVTVDKPRPVMMGQQLISES